MSLNYKNASIKTLSTQEVSNNDVFTEVKKSKKKNQINTVSIVTYDKECINEIINDKFELEYSGSMIEAKIDFEDMVENEFYLKFKHQINSKSLHDIMKYHSINYYNIKKDVHKNKLKYL